MKKLALLMAAMLLMLAGCKNPELETVEVDSVSVSPTSLDLKVGESATLTATVKPDNASDKTVSWQSTAPAVAKVENGVVTALSEGTAYIHATAGGETGICTVTVSAAAVPVESITLDFSEKELTEGESFTLTATVLPADATDKSVSWYAMNAGSGILSVSGDGTVTALAPGHETVIASCGDARAYCEVTVVKAGPKMVDLGLSVPWADRNVGAEKPEEYGDYYAWGETEAKSYYEWNSYKWCNASRTELVKYNVNPDYGVVDLREVLDDADDAARVKWGDKWRMPSVEEINELIATHEDANYKWERTTMGESSGWKITYLTNGNSIFLPAAGMMDGSSRTDINAFCGYWSSALHTDSYSGVEAAMIFWSYCTADYQNMELATGWRCWGFSIRPVYGEQISVTDISLDATSATLTEGEFIQLHATVAPDNAFNKTLVWTSSDESVAKVVIWNGQPGFVVAEGAGNATITAASADGKVTATCAVTVKPFVFEMVDLGLSVKWANANVGAKHDHATGDFFAWGEIEPKTRYHWDTYKWCTSGAAYDHIYSKYNTSEFCGEIDNKTILEAEDDVAHVRLGDGWRIPTRQELDELKDNCTWTWIYGPAGNGCIVTSKINGKSIYMPATGQWQLEEFYSPEQTNSGVYWSSSLTWSDLQYLNSPDYTWGMSFSEGDGQNVWTDSAYTRAEGFAVRAVYGDYPHVSSIVLNETSMKLELDQSAIMRATILPDNAAEKGIVWSSSDPTIVSVDRIMEDGVYMTAITAHDLGTVTITATSNDGGVTATCTVKVGPFEIEAVDLGLSVKWANANLGAAGEAQIGWGYAWGEVPSSLTGKDKYDWNTYKWCNGSYNSLTKYNNNGSYGVVDNLMQLAIEDDIAHAYLGGNWRMPTFEEMQELMERCTWTPKFSSYTSYYIVTGPNGNSILMNLTGYMQGNKMLSLDERGAYWTSTLNPYDPSTAKVLSFNTSNIYIDSEQRRWGLNVRPVMAE